MKTIKIAFYVFLSVMFFNSCQKEYSVETGGVIVPSGNWEFKDASKQFQGNMDTAYIDSSGSTKELHLIGTSITGSQIFHLHLYAGNFTKGTYKASLFQSSFTYTSGSKQLYNANQLIGEFVVNITSYGNNLIAGTFSGFALDSSGAVIQLTQGKFTSALSSSGNSGGGGISSGVLGDSSGTCKPVTLSGSYSPGNALNDTNTVQLEVTVAVPGSYTISSNTANGISFAKSGTFTSAGVQTVTLNGNGIPVSNGMQNFTVTYGNSQCTFTINFGSSAIYTLGGSGGNCTPFTLGGIYQQGILLNPTNSVQLEVTVSALGNYTISTGTVNGVSFVNSGTFTTTGLQIITLAGGGTPVNAGPQDFVITGGTSTCNFTIPFLPGVAPSGDYFPTTLNSHWTYGRIGGTSSDSVHYMVINYSPMFIGNTYSTITADLVPPTGVPDSSYYRKPGGDYFEYVNYSNYIPFDQPVDGEFIFIKDNVPVGTNWQSPNVSGSISGLPFSGYIEMTLLEKAVPVTIGTFNFPDVIKIKYEFFITGSPVAIETNVRWFARNVGEIHFDYDDGTNPFGYDIGRYQIF
ncbi:MAG TPA: hypothetical protein VGP55_00930 [Chitinophagaceae bacterium]|nr:hypothetical protein [Chitinophagaceae bacterium]